MAPFMPKGDRSQRVIVTELVKETPYGRQITYEQLGAALDLDPDTERAQIRQAVAAARDIVTLDYSRALIAVRGIGYRVARPAEHAGIAQGHRRKADRQMSRALDVIKHVDESEMTPAERRRHQMVATVITNLHRRMTGAEARLERLEAVVFADDGPTVIEGRVEE